MQRTRMPRKSAEGVLLLTAGFTIVITAVVGVGAAVAIIDRSSGCSQVYTSDHAGSTIEPELSQRCREAFAEQLEIAGASASFVPTGGDDAVVTAPMATLVDRASRPAPTADAPLPEDVRAPPRSGGGVEIIHYTNADGSMGSDGVADVQVEAGSPPIIRWDTSAIPYAVAVQVFDRDGATVYGVVTEDDLTTGEEIPIRSPVLYGDYGVGAAVPDAAMPSPPLQPGSVYIVYVSGPDTGANVSIRY